MNWSQYPYFRGKLLKPKGFKDLKMYSKSLKLYIPYGKGRSYNDACLSPNMISSEEFKYFIEFDEKSGTLHLESGVTLNEVIRFALSRGFFPYVVPGTKYVSIGGAISADIHGKNNHKEGSFCEYVEEISLLFPSGEVTTIKKDSDLFKYVCGGLGLFGFILSAKIKLKRVSSSFLQVKIVKPSNIYELFDLFRAHESENYSVAWLDLSSKPLGKKAIFFCGNFTKEGGYNIVNKKSRKVIPGFSILLNKFSIRAYNRWYYLRNKEGESIKTYEEFFFPLDSWRNWYKFYGCRGFIQSQFIIPSDEAINALEEVFHILEREEFFPYLAVLKNHKKKGKGILSFTMEGFSLALDFPFEEKTFRVLELIDAVIEKYEGRHYLVKDSRIPRETLERTYKSSLEDFRSFRKALGVKGKIESFLSLRLDL